MKWLKINALTKRCLKLRNFAIIFMFFFLFSCENIIDKKHNLALEYVDQIENYYILNNKFPNSLLDIGVEQRLEGPIYYYRISEDNYMLWYGTYVGESIIYYSDKEIWVSDS